MLITPARFDPWIHALAVIARSAGWHVKRAIALPADEADHGFPTEWWYVVAHVTATGTGYDDRRLAFETTVFRLADPLAGVGLAYGAYVALIDVDAQRYEGRQRITLPWEVRRRRHGFVGTFPPSDPAQGAAWTIGNAAKPGRPYTYAIDADLSGRRLVVDLESTKKPLLHGDDGCADMGLGDGVRAAYYAHTAMTVTGTFHDGAGDWSVTGRGWVDHQWGLLLAFARRWQFFAIHLDQNEELACYAIEQRRDGARVARGARLVRANGDVVALDFELTVATGAGRPADPDGVYPLAFDLTLTVSDGAGASVLFGALKVDARFAKQVRNPSAIPLLATFEFWEGVCAVTGTLEGASRTGEAFMELGGYAKGGM